MQRAMSAAAMTRTSSLKESLSASLPLSCLNQREITNRDLFFSVLLALKDLLEFVSRVQVLGVIVSMERIFRFGVLYMGKGIILGFISRRTCSLFPFADNTYSLWFLDSRPPPLHTSLQSRFSSHCVLGNYTILLNFLVCLQKLRCQDWSLLWSSSQ